MHQSSRDERRLMFTFSALKQLTLFQGIVSATSTDGAKIAAGPTEVEEVITTDVIGRKFCFDLRKKLGLSCFIHFKLPPIR